jgi:hypothetical protein
VEPYGDRQNELVFIGTGIDRAALEAAFHHCVLTDRELAAGAEGWQAFDDPFPDWSHEDQDEKQPALA